MGGLDRLLALAGTWRGVSRLQDPETSQPEDSDSTLTVAPVLHDTFALLTYTWAYHGTPQEGLLLIGYQAAVAVVTAYWADTWHMGDQVMTCEGTVDGEGGLALRGSYGAPPNQVWGWRIELTQRDDRTLTLTMYNVTPDGQEALAVEAAFMRP